MDPDIVDDRVIDAAAALGAQRCLRARRYNSASIRPDDKEAGWSAETARRHRAACKPNELRKYFHELLHRAEAFTTFMDQNTGLTEEYPIEMYFETRETAEMFRAYFVELRDAVGLLNELGPCPKRRGMV